MYNFISDPDSLKRYPIHSTTGQKIINMYINKLNGGSSPPVTPRRLNSMFDDASSSQSPKSTRNSPSGPRSLSSMFDEVSSPSSKSETESENRDDSSDRMTETSYYSKIKDIEKKISEAMTNNNRKEIVKLMREKSSLEKSKPIIKQKSEKPRLDCNNELCSYKQETGLVDIITGDCYDANKLERLSDGYCYYKHPYEGISKMMSESDTPVRSGIGLNFNLLDYQKILGFEMGKMIYQRAYAHQLWNQIDTLDYQLELEKSNESKDLEKINSLNKDLDDKVNKYRIFLEQDFPELMKGLKDNLTGIESDRKEALDIVINRFNQDDENIDDIIGELLGTYPRYELLESINDDYLWELDTLIMNRYRENDRDLNTSPYSPRIGLMDPPSPSLSSSDIDLNTSPPRWRRIRIPLMDSPSPSRSSN